MVKKLPHLLRSVGLRMGNRFIIILIILTTAFTLAGAIWLVALMKSETLAPQIAGKDDCASCHAETYTGWHKGAHSDIRSKNALAQESNCLACHKEIPSDSAGAINVTLSFADFWVKEGMPNYCPACHVSGYDETTNTWKSDGIACETCHGIIPENHPDAVVSINKSEENCRTCHTDDRFDWGKWKDSVHFQNSITCVDCHNPHTTSLKIIGQSHVAPSQLCGNCHEKLAESSEHSIHADIGITCTECHLGDPKGNDDFHQISDHDFNAKIETCNKCHLGQMHLAGEPKVTSELRAFSRTKAGALSKDSAPNEVFTGLLPNSVGFIVVTMLFGVIGGAALRKSISS